MACIPGRESEFRESVHRALDYAAALDCKLIHLMAGVQPKDVPYETGPRPCTRSISPGRRSRRSGRGAPGDRGHQPARHPRLLPAHPGAGGRHRRGHRRRPGRPAVRHLPLPDRAGRRDAPARGAVARSSRTCRWPTCPAVTSRARARSAGEFLFGRIQALGYQGWIGCEYQPEGDTVAGLSWRQRYGV